jgi:hypothetical protein
MYFMNLNMAKLKLSNIRSTILQATVQPLVQIWVAPPAPRLTR